MAVLANNPAALGQIGKFKAENDGSVAALAPPDDLPVEVLAAEMVPLIRDILWQLMPGKPHLPDSKIRAAILNSVRDSFDDAPSAASAAPVA